MSLRVVGVVLLLLGSLAIGIGFGELCFRLFVSAVPRIELSKFNSGSAHIAYILYGAGLGLAVRPKRAAGGAASPAETCGMNS